MSDEIAAIISDAQNLRDYALLSGSVKPDDLIKSLTPFDLDPGLRDEEKLKQLQADVTNVAKSIDPDTRHKVLLGEFRRIVSRTGPDGGQVQVSGYAGFQWNWTDYASASLLVLLGVATLCLLSSYSMLAVRSSQWLTEFKQRGDVDYVSEMNSLFTIAFLSNASPAATGAVPVSDTPGPQTPDPAAFNFLSRISRLNAMLAHDATLQNEANEIELKYYWCKIAGGAFPQLQRITNFVMAADCAVQEPLQSKKYIRDSAIARTTTPIEPVSISSAVDGAIKKIETAQQQVTDAAASSSRSAKDAAELAEVARQSWRSTSRLVFNALTAKSEFPTNDEVIAAGMQTLSQETTNQWIVAMNALTAKASGSASSGAFPADPRSYNTSLAIAGKKLQRYLDIMNGWILPILFGALGAIVLCLTRTASRFYATPGLAGIASRLALATLGGALISIIFAPTYFADGVKAGSSFVFLLCFVFGYSTSAFVTLLDNIANKLAGTKV